MLIRVIYNDKRYDMVKDYVLQQLLEAGEIWGFKRSTGWVVVGEDPIRNEQRPYYGSDRRKITKRPTLFRKWRDHSLLLR